MDYSNVSNDLDNAGGSSPWATTSPRSDRDMFAHVTGESSPSPPSPVPGEHEQSGDQSPTSSRYPSVATNVTPTAGPVSAEDEVDSPDLSERLQSAQLGDPDYLVEHERSPYHQHLQAQQYSAESPRQTAARYQQQGPKPQRPVPVYKLQAKITALERTGRKDPILRFDVHVRQTMHWCSSQADCDRQTCPSSGQRSFETCDGRILNSSSSPTISYPPIPKPLSPPYRAV